MFLAKANIANGAINMKINMRVLVPESRQKIYSLSVSFGFEFFRCKKTNNGLIWSSHGPYGDSWSIPDFCYSLSSSTSTSTGHSR